MALTNPRYPGTGFSSSAKLFALCSGLFATAGVMTLINSYYSLLGTNLSLPFSLGTSQLIDGTALVLAEGHHFPLVIKAAAFSLDLILIACLALASRWLRLHSHNSKTTDLFLFAMIFYTFDSLLFLLAQSYLGLACHLVFLVLLFAGFRASQGSRLDLTE